MKEAKIIAICNQKGGVGKTTTTVNLGIGLAKEGKRVLVIDADPQGDLTTCLGWKNGDELQTTVADLMNKTLTERPIGKGEGILHHEEGVDLRPSNLELSAMEMNLVNAMRPPSITGTEASIFALSTFNPPPYTTSQPSAISFI